MKCFLEEKYGNDYQTMLRDFIPYLEKTAEEDWCTDIVRSKDGKNCLFGHLSNFCGHASNQPVSPDFDWFEMNISTDFVIYAINDAAGKGWTTKYQQPTPKQRCIAYMRDLLSGEELTTMPAMEKSMKEHKEYLAKEAALAKIIGAAGKDPSEITDAVWAAGYRKPERTEEEAINLAIDTFTDSRYNGIPEDVWPKTYDEILRCELNEIIEEELQCYFSDDIIANRLIKAGYSPENAND